MSANVAKIFQFSVKEQLLLLEAWFVFFKWDLLISFTEYSIWREKLSSLIFDHNLSDVRLTPTEFEQVKLIIKMSEISGRYHVRKMNCLRRCLTQKQLLNKRGYRNAKIHIGVAIKEGKLCAHSWLTYSNKVINDSADVTERYKELELSNSQNVLNSLK